MSYEDEQLDEIMVIQNIYGEEICICDPKEKPIKGTILANVDIGLGKYDFTCNGDLTPLTRLSPVILNFSFSVNYPYESPPDFILACLWLTSQQLENLSNILKDKWKASCGVILFTWMDLLKTEIFNLLDIKFPLEISEENMKELIETNLLKEEEIFQSGLYSCPICLTELPGRNCTISSDCGHVFCKQCLASYLSMYISDGNVNFLFCPNENCEAHVHHHIIKSLVSESQYERYDELLLRKTLSKMSDIQYCPRVGCGKPAIVDDDQDSLAFCHACNFAFCIKCNYTYHGIDLCKADKVEQQKKMEMKALEKNTQLLLANYKYKTKKKLRLLKYEKQEFEMLVLANSFKYGSNVQRDILISNCGKMAINNALSASWMFRNSKRCPNCLSFIQKISGCDHMFCTACRKSFMWSLALDILKLSE